MFLLCCAETAVKKLVFEKSIVAMYYLNGKEFIH